MFKVVFPSGLSLQIGSQLCVLHPGAWMPSKRPFTSSFVRTRVQLDFRLYKDLDAPGKSWSPFLLWPGVKLSVFALGWPDPSPSLLGSVQQIALKSNKISLAFVIHLQHKTSGHAANPVIQSRSPGTYLF